MMNNVPLWVKIIGYFGFPVAVASLLLWMVVGQIDIHNRRLEAHDVKEDMVAKQIDTDARHMREALDHLTYILQTMCQNAAKSKEESARCLEKP